jgi:hypothetical protein
MKKTLAAVAAFGIAFGYVEAAVVVYLRLHYYPEGFTFPLAEMPWHVALVEVAREAATIIMLAAISWLAGRRFLVRFANFAFAFAVWDIFYYVFLKIILDWPASLLTWDVLFLIPLPWLGPVLAPVLVSLCLIGASVIILRREETGRPVTIGPLQWVVSGIGGALIVVSFLTDTGAALQHQMPEAFNWLLFAAGLIVGIAGFVWALRPRSEK